jgi:hypothetical protein
MEASRQALEKYRQGVNATFAPLNDFAAGLQDAEPDFSAAKPILKSPKSPTESGTPQKTSPSCTASPNLRWIGSLMKKKRKGVSS